MTLQIITFVGGSISMSGHGSVPVSGKGLWFEKTLHMFANAQIVLSRRETLGAVMHCVQAACRAAMFVTAGWSDFINGFLE